MADSPILPGLRSWPIMPPEWFRFFREQQVVISQLESQPPPDALGFLPDTTTARGLDSIVSTGSLSGGSVVFRFANDELNPGNGYMYATGDEGDKGWRSIASGFVAGTNITLTTAATGVTTIDAEGQRPMVTGEVPPVLVYLDDGSLISSGV